MPTTADLYRASTCPEILWYCEITLGGAGIPPLSFGTAYEVGGVSRFETSAPVFDFRADFSDAATTVSAVTFAIDPDDFDLGRQLLDGLWEGRPAAFFIGLRGWQKDDYVQVFSGVVQSIEYDLEKATLAVRAQNAGLRKEVRQLAYLGDDTIYEGPPELSGNRKKLGLGHCLNDRPDLVSFESLVYSYSQLESAGCDAVFDNAIALDKGPDIGPLEDLTTIDPPADGTFRDQPSKSCFVLGAPPSDTSSITCSFRGSAENGGYQDTTAGIVLQLIRAAGYDTVDLEPVSFAALEAAYPHEVGIVIEPGESFQAAIKRLLGGCHADFGVGPTGLFEFWLYRTGGLRECGLTIPSEMIVGMQRGQNLPPVDTLVINGERNNTVQEQVAQGAEPEDAAFVSKPFRPYGEPSEAMEDAYEDAETVTIDTFLVDKIDARTFHDELAPTFLGKRGTWLVTLACHAFRIQRGQTVCFETPALGLDRGPLYVERVREFAGTALTELTLARTDPV